MEIEKAGHIRPDIGNKGPVLGFLVVAVGIYLGNYAIVQWHWAATKAPTPEWPLLVDFLVLLPVLYLALFRPSAKKAFALVIAIVSVGIVMGSLLIPSEHKVIWRHLEHIRWIFLVVLITLQAMIVVAAGMEIYRHRHAKNVEQAIDGVLSKRVPQGPILRLLRADARVWTYALLGNRSRFQFPTGAFHCSQHDLNASNQQAFLWLVAFEIPLAHAVIHLFSPTWALIISGLSVYGFLFLLAEYRATLFRATTLEETALHIRHGVLGDLAIRYRDIEAVVPESVRPRRAKHKLRFVGTGTANIKLLLKPGTKLETILGAHEVDTVFLGLDEPLRFMTELAPRLRA